MRVRVELYKGEYKQDDDVVVLVVASSSLKARGTVLGLDYLFVYGSNMSQRRDQAIVEPSPTRSDSSGDDAILSASSPPPGYEEQEDPALTEAIEDAIQTFPRHHTATASESTVLLSKPIAIPQAVPGMGKPFARAYPPELEQHDLPVASFVQLIDTINYLATSSPPLQALGLVGTGLGFVPHWTFQVAGMGVNAASVAANISVARIRTKKFVQRVNAEIFAPRGLHFTIMKFDRLVKEVLGAQEKEELMVPTASSPDDFTNLGSGMERRLDAMAGRIAPLELSNLPPIDTSRMSTLSQLTTKQTQRAGRKGEEKQMKDRRKALKKMEEKMEEADKELQKLDKEALKANRKAEKEISKVLRKEDVGSKAQKDIAKAEKDRDEDLRKIDKDRRKVMQEVGEDVVKEDKEVKKSGKGLWIVIRTLPVD